LGDLGSSSSSRGAPTHTKTQKKKYKLEGKKKKTLRSFQSGELLLCALYYGGRNSRHKSCCRPRQKTCLNYKVTRKNNQKKKMTPSGLSLVSLSHFRAVLGSLGSALHTVRCAPLPSLLGKKKNG
jgi:hypothetical protein